MLAGTAVLCAAVGLAACATSVPATESQRRVVDIDRGVYHSTDQGIAVNFNAPRDAVWKALLAAYDDVGLTGTATDTTNLVVSRKKVLIRNVFHGRRASQLFSCGETATGSAQADVGQIIADVRSQVVPGASATRVATLVDAWVIPDGGTSSNSLHCGSTGVLEGELHKALATRLGQLAPGD